MPSMSDLYIGLMSGTSLDAIDAVLVDLSERPKLLASHSHPLPEELRLDLLGLLTPAENELYHYAQTDVTVARLFAAAVEQLLHSSGYAAADIRAIGSHGQTVRHLPAAPLPTSLQIGDPNIIAERTGITTVADFRRRDMAAGGQGAPLVPAFHAALLGHTAIPRAIVNIGGIANLTCLPGTDATVTGYDTGPGNALLNGWISQQRGAAQDTAGHWAASGKVEPALLNTLLDDPYFKQAPPKSTGREYFNMPWLRSKLSGFTELDPVDIQATLCELTCRCISRAIEQSLPSAREILICGGGVHNTYLMKRLQAQLAPRHVASIAEQGIDPDWLEAMAFAWLAKQTLETQPGNLPSVTGAKHPVVLGGIYPGNGN